MKKQRIHWHWGKDDNLFHFLPTISFDAEYERLSFQWFNFYIDLYFWRKRYV